MKNKIFIAVALLALAWSSYWGYNTGFKDETILAIITSFGGLLTALYTRKSAKGSQSIVVKGNRNISRQQVKNSGEIETGQKIKVRGEDNETVQEL